MPRTDAEWGATFQQAVADTTIDLLQLRDQIFVHYRNGKNYVFVDIAQIQIDGNWKRAVIYREEGGAELYARPFLEFIRKFQFPKNADVNRPSTTPKIAPPETPMCDRLRACGDQHRVLVEFVDSLCGESIELAYTALATAYHNVRTDDLIFKFLEIDKKQLEEERRALLEYQRKLNEG